MKILTKTTTVRLPRAVHDDILALSRRQQTHVSTLLRQAILEFVRSQIAVGDAR